MLVTQLFHVAIKTPSIEATRRFYVDALGIQDRPGERFFDAARDRRFYP